MTEEEWQTERDVHRMLRFLLEEGTHRKLSWFGFARASPRRQGLLGSRPSDRKLRWFTTACARRAPHLIAVPELSQLVEVGENVADGAVGATGLLSAIEAALHLPHVNRSEYTRVPEGYLHFNFVDDLGIDISYTAEYYRNAPYLNAAEGALWATLAVWKEAWLRPNRRFEQVSQAAARLQVCHEQWVDRWMEEHAMQVTLLRDIFGNPFRPVNLDSCWLTQTVTALAQTIYADRQLPSGLFDNARLAVLADALEDAGCDHADLLRHLRNGGDHVRGCWAVDLILGKE